MKILLLTLSLTLSLQSFAQDKIVGRYRDYFGSRIRLNPDNSFKYTWNFDMSSNWTRGTWTLVSDTIYFHMIPTYDTLSQINLSGVQLTLSFYRLTKSQNDLLRHNLRQYLFIPVGKI